MTLEEAIKHAEEVADKCDLEYNKNSEQLGFVETFYNAKKCAEEHRQLAEWLKDYQRMQSVIEDIKAEIEEKRDLLMKQGGVYEHSAYGLDYAILIIDGHIGKEN